MEGISRSNWLRFDLIGRRRALRICIASVALLLAAGPVRAATAAVSISSVGPPTARVGDDFVSTLTITNAGPDTATDVEVTDPLSSALVLASATTDRGVCDVGATVACHLGALASGDTARITVRATSIAPGEITVTASVATPDDAVTDDNAAARTVSSVGPTCSVVGTPGPDALASTDALEVLCGLGGTDTIDAGARDRVIAGDGDDIVTALDDAVVVEGGRGNDRITGSAAADLLRGGTGDDVIAGGGGDDHLDGGPGSDGLDGGEGHDACTETGSSCYLVTDLADARDTDAPLDIMRVRTTFGRTTSFVFDTWNGWIARNIEERGYFVVNFDTTASSASDYAVVVRAHRGVVRATLFRVTTSSQNLIVPLVVRQMTRSRLAVTVPVTRMARGAGRAMYRWAPSTLWISDACSRTVCLDGAPSPKVMLAQPWP